METCPRTQRIGYLEFEVSDKASTPRRKLLKLLLKQNVKSIHTTSDVNSTDCINKGFVLTNVSDFLKTLTFLFKHHRNDNIPYFHKNNPH